MKENDLLVNQRRYKAKRKPTRPKPKAAYPNQIWVTDMTKIKIGIWGWYYLVIVLDWFTKEIIGYHLGLQSKSRDWQKATDEVIHKRFPKGIKESP